jgi:putative transposase
MAEMKRMTADEVVGYLLEGEGVDVLRESLAWVVQQLMEAEVSELVGAERGERAPEERLTHRNGYRLRPWSTRAGELELAIPKIRRGSYFPSFLEPRKRSEQALVSVVQESYVAGVSTRKVDQVVESLGLRISKSEVSRICQGLDEQVDAFGSGRSRAATRTCGWTRRWRKSETAGESSASAWCSPTGCTSRATGR